MGQALSFEILQGRPREKRCRKKYCGALFLKVPIRFSLKCYLITHGLFLSCITDRNSIAAEPWIFQG